MSDLEQQNAIMKLILTYLLYERKQETQLGMAFAVLCQERHNEFHTLNGSKEGDGSNFADCKNELCQQSFAIMKDSRSMAIEVNQFTVQLLEDYKLTVQKVGTACRAWLEEKNIVLTPNSKIIAPTDPGKVDA